MSESESEGRRQGEGVEREREHPAPNLIHHFAFAGIFILRLDEHVHEFIGEEREMRVLLGHPDGTPVMGQDNKQAEVCVCCMRVNALHAYVRA